jgi:hypothetical protein
MAEERLIHDALTALKRKVGIEGRLIELQPIASGENPADAVIDLTHERTSIRYLVECKTMVDRKAQIDKIRQRLAGADAPGLLIAPRLTRELAEYCRAIGMQFIDASGNAYLYAPGLFVFISGEKDERKSNFPRAPKGIANPAALRVVFGLLANPGELSSPYKDIARHAAVSLGTVYNVLEDLESRGYLINKKASSGRRKLLEAERLIEEWAVNYPTTLRSKLNVRRFSAPESSWWKSADLDGFDCAWGSEVAATKMTGYLKPDSQTLYVQAEDMEKVIKSLVKQHRIRPDEAGHIEILEKFWHWDAENMPGHAMPGLAPPLLIYSELLALLDPRTRETAQMIKENFIDASFDQT